MKKTQIIISCIIVSIVFITCGKSSHELHTGDIIFQTSYSAQSEAIKLATNSKYSHMGIIVKKGGKTLVFHAVNPVRYTTLKEWVDEGVGGYYAVKRLKKQADAARIKALLGAMEAMKGKPYDKYFGWGDDKIYCSEMVWKAYKNGMNCGLCGLKKMRDFDLSSPVVKKMLKQRYGDKVPLDEPVVSPADIFESKELVSVEEK